MNHPIVRRVETLPAGRDDHLPALIEEAGNNARYAYEEFLFGDIENLNTRTAYRRDVDKFLVHVHEIGLAFHQVTPKLVRSYIENMKPARPGDPPLSAPTKKRVLAAIRKFFDVAVTRHAIPLNPALSVRGPKHQVIEGKTPEITVAEARKLLGAIDTTHVVGLRDRAILATMIYTGARVGAVAKLTLQGFYCAGDQWCFRFEEKGGKSREIPCRHDLQVFVLDYLNAAGVRDEKTGPLFRSAVRREKRLTDQAMTANDMCRMVKRRLKDVGLSSRLSPHSFRVTVATDLLSQDVPLEEVQYLLGHADPRTTRLYDRRQRKVTPNIVERISV